MMSERKSEKMVVRRAINNSIDRELELIDCYSDESEPVVIEAREHIRRCREILEKYFGSRKTYKELWWDENKDTIQFIDIRDIKRTDI